MFGLTADKLILEDYAKDPVSEVCVDLDCQLLACRHRLSTDYDNLKRTQHPRAQEFSQNVKEVYFPFNVYSKAVNPAALDSDAEWLKQHSDTHFWIQGYADFA